MTMAIEVEKLVKRRGRTLALDDVSLSVARGEFYALLGANGAGKTTLMHCLTTISQPDQGRISVNGLDAMSHPRQVRERIGVVFQEQSLDGQLSLYENLEFHGLVYRVPRRKRRARIEMMLELAGLADLRERPVHSLSTGMRRRLEIARGLLHEPEILFLDEPTVGLDPAARQAIWAYIAALRQSQQTTLMVTTHYIEEVERCDRVCILARGKVVAEDSPEALRRQYGRALIRLSLSAQAQAEPILAAYPTARREGAEIVIDCAAIGAEELAVAQSAMARWPDQVARVAFEPATLGSAFMQLVGGAPADQA